MATATQIVRALREAALRHDGVDEGIACPGTPLEKRTLKAAGKAFAFLGRTDVMLKLGPSVKAATKLAKAQPTALKVGKNGWVTIKLDGAGAPPLRTLQKWLAESHSLLTSK